MTRTQSAGFAYDEGREHGDEDEREDQRRALPVLGLGSSGVFHSSPLLDAETTHDLAANFDGSTENIQNIAPRAKAENAVRGISVRLRRISPNPALRIGCRGTRRGWEIGGGCRATPWV